MSRKTEDGIERLFASSPCLRIPSAWFQRMPNHAAAVLLADILSSYLDARRGLGDVAALMDRAELLLEYKQLAARLGLSTRTVSRSIDWLVKCGTIRRTRRDRIVNGKPTRNVVGVVPDLEVIAKMSGIPLGDILSAPRLASVPARTERDRIQLAAPVTTAEPVHLTDFQASLLRAYQDHFEQTVGSTYLVSDAQQMADQKALASLTIQRARGAGRKYQVWARQYVDALKDKAEDAHGEARQAALGRNGQVKDRYTIEAFLAWAKTTEPLPNGFARRCIS